MRLRPLLAALSLFVAPFVALPSPVQADIKIDATFHVRDVVVDDAHSRVYVAPGHGGGGLRVTTSNGAFLDSLEDVVGADGLVLTDGGATLLAAQPGLHQIAMIDTATLTVTGTVSTGATVPHDLAVVSGLIFFTENNYAPGPDEDVDISAVDPETGELTMDVLGAGEFTSIASSPLHPGVLFYASGTVHSFDVTLPAEGGVSVTPRDTVVGPHYNLNWSADGASLLATGSAKGFVLDPADLSITRTVELAKAGHGGLGMAMRADGMVAVSGYDRVTVFKPGESAPWRTYTWPGEAWRGDSVTLARGVLHFGATRLYAATETPSAKNAWLRVITPRSPSAVTVSTNQTRYAYGAAARVTAKLTAESATRKVSIYAKPIGGVRQLVKAGNVDDTGRLTASFQVRRLTTFSVEYAGDAGTDPATASSEVKVHAQASIGVRGEIGRDGKYSLFRTSGKVLTPGSVAPNHQGDCLFFVADYLDGGNWRYFGSTGCVELDEHSKALANLPGEGLGGFRIRFRAVFEGDDINLKDASPWVYVRILG